MDHMNYDGSNSNGVEQDQSPNSGRPVYNEPIRPAAPGQTPGKAVASIILGIVSIVCSCSGLISLVCSIIGLVLCGQMKRELQGLPGTGKAGMALNIIGLVLGIFGILFWLILILFGEWEVNYY